jgi:hypothetical protein
MISTSPKVGMVDSRYYYTANDWVPHTKKMCIHSGDEQLALTCLALDP